MKTPRILIALFVCGLIAPMAQAGNDRVTTHFTPEVNPPSFEMSAETAYMLGWIENPNSYEVGAEFLTARWRFGPVYREGFFRGYNQFYALVMGEPIFRGPENYYFGISVGLRYNFLHPDSRIMPYVSGGVGLGWIDSHSDVFGAQGQDFTFNVLGAAGLSYRINNRWSASLGLVYQHLSNGGQTDPNASLNLLGPQVGVTCSF